MIPIHHAKLTPEPWPFDPLRMFNFDVIEVDPPTDFKLYSEAGNAKSASAQYEIMSWDDLAAMPIGHLAKSNAILLLWACTPTLPESLALMAKWGALYKTSLAWRKVTALGKPRMGPGYRARGFFELVLMGVFGNDRQIHDALMSGFDGIEDPRDSVMFDGLARQHSRKPDEFYEMVRDKTPGLNRCSLFARETRPGFEKWGKEASKFDPPARSERDHIATAAAALGQE